MDGLKGVVPNTCHDTITVEKDLLGNKKTIKPVRDRVSALGFSVL